MEEQTWDTPGIRDVLAPERTTTVNEKGEYCFTVTAGLWRVTVDAMEDEPGFAWKYSSERGSLAFIINEAVPNLRIYQSDHKFTGRVFCIVPSDCQGLEIRMQEAGIANKPDRFQIITHTDGDGHFEFKGVPQMAMTVYVEKRNFCWEKSYHTVTTVSANQHITF